MTPRRITINDKSFNVDIDHMPGFWGVASVGVWEPELFALMDRILTPEAVVIDVGAWIGPVTLYTAQTAKRVLAFEPDPEAYRRLEENIRLNLSEFWCKRIVELDVAIGPPGTMKIGSRSGNPGDSMSSPLFADEKQAWDVPAITLSSLLFWMEKDTRFFIKFDIEGGEYAIADDILKVVDNYDVDLAISLHRNFLEISGGDLTQHDRFLAELQARKRVFVAK